jgi:hypothetical protein
VITGVKCTPPFVSDNCVSAHLRDGAGKHEADHGPHSWRERGAPRLITESHEQDLLRSCEQEKVLPVLPRGSHSPQDAPALGRIFDPAAHGSISLRTPDSPPFRLSFSADPRPCNLFFLVTRFCWCCYASIWIDFSLADYSSGVRRSLAA